MDFYFLTITAISVSVDSLAAGAALGGGGKRAQSHALLIISVVGIICLFASGAGGLLSSAAASAAPTVGGILLLAAGLYGLRPKEKTAVFVRKRRDFTTGQALTAGLGIAADGACACLSLSLLGYGIYSAVTVTLFHYLFIEIGIFLAVKLQRLLGGANVSPYVLIALGLYKFMGF